MLSPICALATPVGTSAIAVVRISGEDTLSLLKKIFVQKQSSNGSSTIVLEKHHKKFLLGSIIESDTNILIDEVGVIPFVHPYSYTGEESAEIHCHGNPLIVEKILKELYKVGCSPASAGEFTKRAFLNGKMDISQAEATAQIIHAQSTIELQKAFSLKKGAFQNEVLLLKGLLLEISSDTIAELDFIDQDIQFGSTNEKLSKVNHAMNIVENIIKHSNQVELYKKGFSVMIFGTTNVGKSSLINLLLGYDRSIVSPEAGTTRDYIQENITIDSHNFHIIDTAGIRTNTESTIEKEGIANVLQKLSEVDIVILLLDCSINIKQSICNSPLKDLLLQKEHSKVVIVGNKRDIMHSSWKSFQREKSKIMLEISKILSIDPLFVTENIQTFISISAKYNENIESLKKEILLCVQNKIPAIDGILLSVWQKEILYRLKSVLQGIYEKLYRNELLEIIATEFEDSMELLGVLLGEISNEDILGNIFSRFCIGK